ncbi:MAG: 50S ribosomal protein L10, partial [bacterium]|nr:50S ribosomal protein L10 [bacterium]
MPLTKEKKQEIVSNLTQNMKDAKSVVFADFRGLSFENMTKLRNEMRENGVRYKVAKKTLLRIAAKEAGYDDIPDEVLEGPVGAAFSMEDEISAAKLIYKFAKKNKNLQLRGALFEGRVMLTAETIELAMLPGKDELIAKFL